MYRSGHEEFVMWLQPPRVGEGYRGRERPSLIVCPRAAIVAAVCLALGFRRDFIAPGDIAAAEFALTTSASPALVTVKPSGADYRKMPESEIRLVRVRETGRV